MLLTGNIRIRRANHPNRRSLFIGMKTVMGALFKIGAFITISKNHSVPLTYQRSSVHSKTVLVITPNGVHFNTTKFEV
jgi:hypothetical protein